MKDEDIIELYRIRNQIRQQFGECSWQYETINNNTKTGRTHREKR